MTRSRYHERSGVEGDHAILLAGIAMNGRLVGFVRRLLRAVNREWGLGIDPRSKQRIKAAAEERFREAFPGRHVSHSRIWSDYEGYFVVAVFQHHIRP